MFILRPLVMKIQRLGSAVYLPTAPLVGVTKYFSNALKEIRMCEACTAIKPHRGTCMDIQMDSQTGIDIAVCVASIQWPWLKGTGCTPFPWSERETATGGKYSWLEIPEERTSTLQSPALISSITFQKYFH